MPSTAATARSSAANPTSSQRYELTVWPSSCTSLTPAADQRAHLAEDLARRCAPLAPARVGDDAEGAELVAAALDRDVADHAVGGDRIEPA